MAFKYTEEQLNKLDKELLIQLFLGLQEQLEALTAQTEALNTKMQQMMEQLIPVSYTHLTLPTICSV